MRQINDAGVMVGGAALAAAVLLFGTLLTRAMMSAPVAVQPTTAVDMATPDDPGPSGEGVHPTTEPEDLASTAQHADPQDPARFASQRLPAEVLRLAVERAPFEPDRQAPAQRYRMPGDRVEATPSPPPELPPAPDLRLLATVAGPDGGVAVLRVGDGTPRVVALGEQFVGYQVASIGSGEAMMSGQGRQLNLMVAGPAPAGPAVEEEDDSRRRRRGEEESAADRRRAEIARALRSRLETLQQRYEAADSEAERMLLQQSAEQLARQIQQLSEGSEQIRISGDRIIFTTPTPGASSGGLRMMVRPRGGGGGG